SRLSKPEHVVYEHQHILILFIAKIFRNREGGKSYPSTRSRRFIHLSINKRSFINDSRFLHFHPEIIPFTCALTNSSKNRITAVVSGNIIDQLHDEDGFTHPGAAKQPNFSTASIRSKQIHNFDSGIKRLNVHRFLSERGSTAVYWITFFCGDRARFV